MKILVVNNGSKEPAAVCSVLQGHELTVCDRDKLAAIHTEDFDLVILTGSSQDPIVYNMDVLADEHELIRTTETPLIGICYGCELIAHAFGGTLIDRGEGVQKRDLICIRILEDDPMFDGRSSFEAYDAHRWVIETVPESFVILAESDHGPEVIRHKNRPIWGFQFHPEKCTEKSFGDEMLLHLIQSLQK